MKAIVFVLILAAAGWYAYDKGWIGGGEGEGAVGVEDADGTQTAPVTSDNEAAAVFADPAAPAASGDPATGTSPATVTQTPAAGGGLTDELRQRLAKADAAWDAIANAGGEPAKHQQAPQIAQDYSAVLKATYNQPDLFDLEQRLISRLTPLGDTLFFSAIRFPEDTTGVFGTHDVQSGDLPSAVAKTYGISYQFLNYLRGSKPEDGAMRLGEQLKIVHARDKGGFEIFVDKSDFRADVYVCGIFARRYAVGIGAPGSPTPTGRARIDQREREMNWTNPNTGEVLAWNHPENVLGAVWLRLKSDEIGQSGIGLHGYNGEGPATGAQGSNGCVRFANSDAREVFNLMVPVGYYETEGFLQRAPMWVNIAE